MGKNRKIIIFITLIFLVIIGILIFSFIKYENKNNSMEVKVGQTYTPRKENIKTDEKTGIKYINNEIMIIFRSGVSKDKKIEIINSINGKIVGIIGKDEEWDWVQVEVSERSLEELEAMDLELQKRYPDEVFGSITDTVVKLDNYTNTNDPGDEKEWKKRKLKSANWWLNAIQAHEAWEYNNRFNNVKIGIVDSGFDTGHEDLNIYFADEINEKLNNKDDHGTHVSGIIGATANNGKGVAGIVWNKELICHDWNPTWLQEKLDGWNTEQAIIGGLYYTVTSGAKVINFSCGIDTANKESGLDCNKGFTEYSQEFLDKSANKASRMMSFLLEGGYDFVVIQAAGNGDKNRLGIDAKNSGFFASITAENCYTNSNVSADDILDRIIVVANAEQIDNGYQIYKSSNGGSRIDVAAPGRNIYSCITGEALNITQTKGSYGYMSGTSMAAPMVTGVASLVWSVNKDFTGEEVKDIVCNNYSEWVKSNSEAPNAKSPYADKNGCLGYPMVNAKLAVEEAIRRTDTLVVPIEDETQSTEFVEIEETKNYEWYLNPTIEADNIIVPDYDNELFEKYAIIEKNGKYGLISNNGNIEIKCNHVGYSICSLEGTYIMANKIENNYISESDDYIYKDSKLIKSQHGGHDFWGEHCDYIYDVNNNKVFIRDLGELIEYTESDIYPAQEVFKKNEKGYYDEYGKWGIISGDSVIKNFEYDNGRYSDNLVALEKNELWGYFDQNGKEIIPFIVKRSDYINGENFMSSTYTSDNMAFMDIDGILAVNTKDGGCFYDIKGNQLTNSKEFEEVRPMINGFAWVKKDGKWGVIKFDSFDSEENSEDSSIEYIEQTENSIKFTYKENSIESLSSDGTLVYTTSAKYPIFEGENVKILNDEIQKSIVLEGLYQEDCDELLKDWKELQFPLPTYDKYEFTVTYNHNGYISIIEYGANNGGYMSSIYYFYTSFIYDINAKKLVKYSDFFDMNEKELQQLVFSYSDLSSSQRKFYSIETATLTQDGMKFYLSDGPHAKRHEVTIPFSDSNFIKKTNNSTSENTSAKNNKGTVKIEDGYLNVRETPSTKGKIIAKLYNGDKITIEETSEDGKWYKISKGDIKGYVSKDYVKTN